MDYQEKQIGTTPIFNGKIIRVRVDDVTLPNGKHAKREVVSHRGGCSVVPVTEDGKILLVRQFRYPYGEELYELPAGKLEEGEDPLVCAVRELQEETGAVAKEVICMGEIYPTPGYTDEKIHLYLARGLELGAMQPDEDEFLDVKAFTFKQLRAMIADNALKDAKTVIGILRYLAEFRA